MTNTNSITLNQKELKEALKVFKTVITSKCQYNIESNILLSYQDNVLNIIGTDGITFIKHSIKIKESSTEKISSFSVYVLLKKLDSIVKEMEKDIDFNLSVSSNDRITIEYRNSSSFIIGMNSSDFPDIPEIESNNVISINDASNFKKVITKANKSSAKEALKPSLQSVYFDIINQNEINLVATDGKALFQETINSVNNSSEIDNLLIKNTTINTLILAIKKDTGTINVISNKEYSRFTFDNYQITTRKIEGKFPNYKTVIPKEHKYFITLNKKEVLKAIKIVRVMANNKTLYIKSFNKLVYIVGIDDNIGQSQVEVASTYDTYRDFEIAFNYKLFEKTIKAIDDETVKISFSDKQTPATFNDKDILMMTNSDKEIDLLIGKDIRLSLCVQSNTESVTSEAIEPATTTPEAIKTIKHIRDFTIDTHRVITRLYINPFIESTKVEYQKKTIVFRDLQAESSYYYRHYKAA